MARRFGRSGLAGRVSTRRKTTWDSGFESATAEYPGRATRTGSGVSLLNGLGVNDDSITLVRSLIDASVFMGAADTIADRAYVSLGLIVVSAEAFAAGVASVPDPRVRAEDDWIWLEHFAVEVAFAAAQGLEGSAGRRVWRDIRAQRKLNIGEVFAWVFATTGQSAGTTVVCNIAARHLFKLP